MDLSNLKFLGRPWSVASVTTWLLILGVLNIIIIVPTVHWIAQELIELYSTGKHNSHPQLWMLGKRTLLCSSIFILGGLTLIGIGISLWRGHKLGWALAVGVNVGFFLFGMSLTSPQKISAVLVLLSLLAPVFALFSESTRVFLKFKDDTLLKYSLISFVIALSVTFSSKVFLSEMYSLANDANKYVSSQSIDKNMGP